MTTFSFLEAKVMEVPINREIPLERAELLLKKQNKIANQEKQEMSCIYDLRIDGQVVYESSLVFPVEDFSLYGTIVKEVEEQEFNSEEEKEAFLEWLSKTFNVKKEKKKATNRPKKEKIKKEKQRQIPRMNKRIAIVFFVVLFFICSAVGIFVYATTPEKRVSYEELVRQEKFIEAGKEYPDKQQEVENLIFKKIQSEEKPELGQLRAYNKEIPTTQGDFDLAMLTYDYGKSTGIYEKEKDQFKNDHSRLPLVGYAYLKEQKLKAAKEISEQTTSPELEKYILEYEQFQLIIQEKEKQIKELQKKPTENKKKIEQAINELYEAKEKLNKL
ncbi:MULTISPECIES: hypothetical protein [Enterococcus]|nr:hypothetical protein [Enterococcus faecalis]OTP10683.1 hypothetical protein A5830_002748 [Enterococcus faecalis]